MSQNLYAQLNDRSKQIFKSVVETYLETGTPSGSATIQKKGGINLSSSSIRAILSNLQNCRHIYFVKSSEHCCFILN